MSPNLSFQCSLTKAATSRTLETSLAHPVCQWPLPMAISRVFPGWTQVDSYRIRRSGRTERGFVHTVHPGANCLPGTGVSGVGLNGGSCIQSILERTAFPELSVRRGMRNRGHNSGVTPVNRKAGMRGARGSHQGKRLVSLSRIGFRHH